jgi:hypothetical protein
LGNGVQQVRVQKVEVPGVSGGFVKGDSFLEECFDREVVRENAFGMSGQELCNRGDRASGNERSSPLRVHVGEQRDPE